MQKSRIKVPVFLIILPVIASCVLRFFLLLKYTDNDTGLITGGSIMMIIMYALAVLSIVLIAVYSNNKAPGNNLLSTDKFSRASGIASLMAAVSLFCDFIHQCINTYYEISRGSYTDYLYLFVLVLCVLFALLSSFYFISYYVTQSGLNYDFKNLNLFHFVPILWGISRLFVMLQKIIELKNNAEGLIEIVFLSCMLGFFICFVKVIDKNGVGSVALVFFAYCAFFVSLLLVAPRILIMLIGKRELLFEVPYTMISYLASGIFAITFVTKRTNN